VIRADLRAAVRDGEQLLLTLGIPVALLVFFTTIDVLPTGTDDPVDYLAPGVLSLALLSIAFVRLAIGLGFDRSFGAIKRFAITPLSVGEFLVAKLLVTVMLFSVQVVVLGVIAAALGWRPSVQPLIVLGAALAVIAFVGLAFVVAGLVEGLKALAVANALYIVLLLVSGIVFELSRLPGWLEAVVRLLPSTATAELFRSTLSGGSGPAWAWIGLTCWAGLAPLVATRVFRYS
jgi:ABC-2 type transport system permease protein